MGFEELMKQGLALALLASIGGCGIRYATHYKDHGSIKYSFFIIDLLIAVFLGYFSFWYSIEELQFKSINAILNNIIIGNLGSRFASILQNIFIVRLNNFLEKILGEPVNLDKNLVDPRLEDKSHYQKYQKKLEGEARESNRTKENKEIKEPESSIESSTDKEGNDDS